MKRFWISWHQPGDDYRPLTYPPNAAVIGWWKSGEGRMPILCAVVAAADEGAACAAVLQDWPEATDWRFCDEKPADWMPNDRFPLSDWMRERLRSTPPAT